MSQANGSTKLKYAKSGIGGGVLMNRKKMRDELLDYDWNEWCFYFRISHIFSFLKCYKLEMNINE